MARYFITTTYQTRTGGMSWSDGYFDAGSTEEALAKMRRRVGKHAVRALDMKAVLVDQHQ